MRASELLKKWKVASAPCWLIPKAIVDAEGFMRAHAPITLIPPIIPIEEILAAVARIEAAVEELAADAGSGPARRIKAILDGEEGT